jgi:hypothetical protein
MFSCCSFIIAIIITDLKLNFKTINYPFVNLFIITRYKNIGTKI